MKKKQIIQALAILAVVLFAVYQWIEPRAKVEPIRVAAPNIIASLPHWVAEDLGLYAEANLDIESVAISNSEAMIQAMNRGDVDVLPAVSFFPFMKSFEEFGISHGVIFSHSRMKLSPAFDALVVAHGGKVGTLKDLEGTTIATFPGRTSEAFLRAFLEQNNINTQSITFRDLPPPEHVLLLMRGDIAAAHMYEPFKTDAMVDAKVRTITDSIYASFDNPSAIGMSAISSQLLKERPRVAGAFLETWNRAVSVIRDNPALAAGVLAKRLKLRNSVAGQATWVDVTRVSELSRQTLEETLVSFQKLGLIKSETKVADELLINAYSR